MPIGCTNCYSESNLYRANPFSTVTLFFSTIALCGLLFLLIFFDCYIVFFHKIHFLFFFFSPCFFLLLLHYLFISLLIFTFFLFLHLKLFISFTSFFFSLFPFHLPLIRPPFSPLPFGTRDLPSPFWHPRPFASLWPTNLHLPLPLPLA